MTNDLPLAARVEVLERNDRRRALSARKAQLHADGYTGSYHNTETAKSIVRVACELCGKRTLVYLGGVVSLNPLSQIEFIQCRSCGWWSEDI